MSSLLAHLTGAGGLLDGLAHPLSGLDHLVAMALVGVLAYLLRERLAWWVLPTTFVGMMIAGGLAGLALGSVPAGVEVLLAGSVVLLAAGLVWRERLVPAAALAGVGAMAVAHGLAHGAEVPTAAVPLAYVGGFATMTAAIHLAGAGVGRLLSTHRLAVDLAGAGAAALGVGLLVG